MAWNTELEVVIQDRPPLAYRPPHRSIKSDTEATRTMAEVKASFGRMGVTALGIWVFRVACCMSMACSLWKNERMPQLAETMFLA